MSLVSEVVTLLGVMAHVEDGPVPNGDEMVPGKVIVVQDPITGKKWQIPFTMEGWEQFRSQVNSGIIIGNGSL